MSIGRIECTLKDAIAAGRGEVGVVRIGISSSLAYCLLADLLQCYQVQNPFGHLNLSLHVLERNTHSRLVDGPP